MQTNSLICICYFSLDTDRFYNNSFAAFLLKIYKSLSRPPKFKTNGKGHPGTTLVDAKRVSTVGLDLDRSLSIFIKSLYIFCLPAYLKTSYSFLTLKMDQTAQVKPPFPNLNSVLGVLVCVTPGYDAENKHKDIRFISTLS